MKTQPTLLARLVRTLTTCTAVVGAAVAAPGCVAELGTGTDIIDVDIDVADESSGSEVKAIVGGSDVAIADHPFQVSLQSGGSHFCGGSIISDRYVVTAQHCVEGEVASRLQVLAGVSRLSRAAAGQTRQVARIIVVPGYRSPDRGKDVALLELARPLTLGGAVQAIGLATAADAVTAAGTPASVTGWGTLRSGGSSPDSLQGVTVPLVDTAVAQRTYRETLTADQLAAGGDGRDSCQGDSGGPLTVASPRGRLLVGVVSWGYGCGTPGVAGLYARVPAFADWIAQQTGLPVGGLSSTTPATPAPAPTVLLDELRSNAAGSFTHTTITVPAGATVLEVTIDGSVGDADLYVRQGSASTTTRFDCRPFTSTSAERCVLEAPAAGAWVVSIAGYSAYENLQVRAEVR